MTKYINTLFAFIFFAICFSCSNRTISDFEVPVAQEQQNLNDGANLDQFVDVVNRFPEENNTEAETEAFYNDNSVPSDQQ